MILVPTALERDFLFGADTLIPQASPDWIVARIGPHRVALCGIGPAAAAMSAYALAARYQPSRIILVGIAGVFPKAGPQPGDLLQVNQDSFADLGYQDQRAFFNLDHMKLPHLPQSKGAAGCRFTLATPFDLPRAAAVTVSTITSSAERADALWQAFGAPLENMEGAAVALAAAQQGIPFSQLRAVSNLVGPRDPKSWLIKEPLARLGRLLRKTLP
nr:futalosine hydrolase [Acanthopleuribacter pedis]